MPSGEDRFLERIVDGRAKLYKYYYIHLTVLLPTPIVIPTPATAVIVGKDDKIYHYLVEKGNFKECGSDYFDDYPQLSNKISTREYKKRDITKVVTEYNEWYAQNDF